MKPLISQNQALVLGVVHGIRMAGYSGAILIALARFFEPAIQWYWPVLFMLVGIAAYIQYTIMVRKIRKSMLEQVKNFPKL